MVAAYLGHKPSTRPSDDDGEAVEAGNPAGWMGGSSLQASAELAAASTPEQALAAAERMFFGQMTELPKP